MARFPVRYLQVLVDLPRNAQLNQMFNQYVRQLMPTFENSPWPGWALFLSATRMPGRLASSAGVRTDIQQYLHIWHVRDYNSLPYIMGFFDDDEVYRQLDNMVLREEQDFVGGLRYNSQTVNPTYRLPSDCRYYLHVTFDVVADSHRLSLFETFMIDCVNDPRNPMGQEFGFTFINGTYAQTGLLRRYFHVWATRARLPPAQEAVDWLSAQSAVKSTLDPAWNVNPQWALWEPLDYRAEDF